MGSDVINNDKFIMEHEKGCRRAAGHFRLICDATVRASERYHLLSQEYAKHTDPFDRCLENFYPDKYFQRGNHLPDNEASMILLMQASFQTMGMLNHWQAAMREQVDADSLLMPSLRIQERLHTRLSENFNTAFAVYYTQGAVLKGAQAGHSIRSHPIKRLLTLVQRTLSPAPQTV